MTFILWFDRRGFILWFDVVNHKQESLSTNEVWWLIFGQTMWTLGYSIILSV